MSHIFPAYDCVHLFSLPTSFMLSSIYSDTLHISPQGQVRTVDSIHIFWHPTYFHILVYMQDIRMSHIFSAYDRVHIFWRPIYFMMSSIYSDTLHLSIYFWMCVGYQNVSHLPCIWSRPYILTPYIFHAVIHILWHPTHIASGPSTHWWFHSHILTPYTFPYS